MLVQWVVGICRLDPVYIHAQTGNTPRCQPVQKRLRTCAVWECAETLHRQYSFYAREEDIYLLLQAFAASIVDQEHARLAKC